MARRGPCQRPTASTGAKEAGGLLPCMAASHGAKTQVRTPRLRLAHTRKTRTITHIRAHTHTHTCRETSLSHLLARWLRASCDRYLSSLSLSLSLSRALAPSCGGMRCNLNWREQLRQLRSTLPSVGCTPHPPDATCLNAIRGFTARIRISVATRSPWRVFAVESSREGDAVNTRWSRCWVQHGSASRQRPISCFKGIAMRV